MKHVNTRWLSLEFAVDRTLRVYPGLRSYFLSKGTIMYSHSVAVCIMLTFTEGDNTQFDRLKKAYEHPITEVYLMFYQAALQLFITFNKFLGREVPLIYVINAQMCSFIS